MTCPRRLVHFECWYIAGFSAKLDGRRSVAEPGGQPATGRMEIVLPGERRVIVDRSVDPSALARVIAVLERR